MSAHARERMANAAALSSGLSPALFAPGGSSFTEFAAAVAPDLLPHHRLAALTQASQLGGTADVPHGTTIVAITHMTGVILAGDRRATMGNVIAQRD